MSRHVPVQRSPPMPPHRQEGKYHCYFIIILHNIIIFQEAKDDSEQEPVAITKSLYMKVEDWVRILLISRSDYTPPLEKVYPFPDYQPDLVVALSGLAVTSVILLVGNTLGSRIENSQSSIIGHPSGREWNQALFHDFGSQVLFS